MAITQTIRRFPKGISVRIQSVQRLTPEDEALYFTNRLFITGEINSQQELYNLMECLHGLDEFLIERDSEYPDKQHTYI